MLASIVTAQSLVMTMLLNGYRYGLQTSTAAEC